MSVYKYCRMANIHICTYKGIKLVISKSTVYNLYRISYW